MTVVDLLVLAVSRTQPCTPTDRLYQVIVPSVRPSYEVAVGLDPKKDDVLIDGMSTLPHGVGGRKWVATVSPQPWSPAFEAKYAAGRKWPTVPGMVSGSTARS